MTDIEMRIAIAEACGWKQTHIMQMGPKGKYVRTYQKGRGKLHQKLPDYLNDLNAMHEAEKAAGFHANTSEGRKLTQKYAHLIGAECESWKGYATARQRAEAFIKTLNLWKD